MQRTQKGSPKEALGRSRGGVSTQIHLRINGAGLSLRTEITLGQYSGYTGYDLVMATTCRSQTFSSQTGAMTLTKFGQISKATTPCR